MHYLVLQFAIKKVTTDTVILMIGNARLRYSF